MASGQNHNVTPASTQWPSRVLSPCVEFLAKAGHKVDFPTSPTSIARVIIQYLGTDPTQPIKSEHDAYRIVKGFFRSRVQPYKPQHNPNRPKNKKKKNKTHFKKAPKDKFYTSFEWKKVRYEALLRSKGRCECCGMSPQDGIILHADHVKPLRRFPDLALDVNNVQILCSSCNWGKGSWDHTDWRQQQIDGPDDLDQQYAAIMGPIPR